MRLAAFGGGAYVTPNALGGFITLVFRVHCILQPAPAVPGVRGVVQSAVCRYPPVVPLVTVVGMLAAVAAASVPSAAGPLVVLSGGGAAWTAGVAKFFDGLPGSLLPWPPGTAGVLLMAAAAGTGIWLLWRVGPPGEGKQSAVAAGAMTRCGAASATHPVHGAANAGQQAVVRAAPARIRAARPRWLDPGLTAYFNSGSFRRLAGASQTSYTEDYRTFFNFLWQRGNRWSYATAHDLDDFEDWRRRAPKNDRTISGAKWVRELAALSRLYRWAQQERIIDVSPVRIVTLRGRHGAPVEVLEATAHDVRTSNVKWLTPRMTQLWRSVGLMGLTRDGRPDESFRGRNGDRNAAFADLLFDSGLRRTEGASILTIEIPIQNSLSRYSWGRVATAVAKYNSGRPFPVSSPTIARMRAYRLTARAVRIQRWGRKNVPDCAEQHFGQAEFARCRAAMKSRRSTRSS